MPRERSFKDYVADRFYNELYDGIQKFIKENSGEGFMKYIRVETMNTHTEETLGGYICAAHSGSTVL